MHRATYDALMQCCVTNCMAECSACNDPGLWYITPGDYCGGLAGSLSPCGQCLQNQTKCQQEYDDCNNDPL
jgi:hypothetical protein